MIGEARFAIRQICASTMFVIEVVIVTFRGVVAPPCPCRSGE